MHIKYACLCLLMPIMTLVNIVNKWMKFIWLFIKQLSSRGKICAQKFWQWQICLRLTNTPYRNLFFGKREADILTPLVVTWGCRDCTSKWDAVAVVMVSGDGEIGRNNVIKTELRRRLLRLLMLMLMMMRSKMRTPCSARYNDSISDKMQCKTRRRWHQLALVRARRSPCRRRRIYV